MKDRAIVDFLTTQRWALHRPTLERLAEVVARHAAGVRLSAAEIEAVTRRAAPSANPAQIAADSAYETRGGVAVVGVRGIIAKHADQVNGSSQPQGSSVERIRAGLDRAMADENVRKIVLRIESAGGSVDGIADLADAVADANETKPVVAFADDLAASAAYWIGSQAGRFYANQSALVGSIGVYAVAIDSSAAAAAEGLRFVLVTTGPNKGAGMPGTEITDQHVAAWQEMIDETMEMFGAAVAKGRGLGAEQLAAVTDGRVWVADHAKRLGLVDAVMTFEQAVAAAAPSPGRRTKAPDAHAQTNPHRADGPPENDSTDTAAEHAAAHPETDMSEKNSSTPPAPDPAALEAARAEGAEAARKTAEAINAELAEFPASRQKALAEGLTVTQAKAIALGECVAQRDAIAAELNDANERLEKIAAAGVTPAAPEPSDAQPEQKADEPSVTIGDDGQAVDDGKASTYAAYVANLAAEGGGEGAAHRRASAELPKAKAAWLAEQPTLDRKG